MGRSIGRTIWAIAEGYIPPDDQHKPSDYVSHETCCILNAGESDAHIEIMIYFSDRSAAGPYHVTVHRGRTLHLRFNDLNDPEPIPHGVDYASTFHSDVPIVIQHTRLDTRHAKTALMSTIAYTE
jgi:hypothetical protein